MGQTPARRGIRAPHVPAVSRVRRTRRGVGAFVALGIAAADEGHQFFLPGRSSDLTDVIADTVGIALTAAVLRQRQKE